MQWNNRIKGLGEEEEKKILLGLLRTGYLHWYNQKLRIIFGVWYGYCLAACLNLKGVKAEMDWCRWEGNYIWEEGEHKKL